MANINYDDTAFLFFLVTMIGLYIFAALIISAIRCIRVHQKGKDIPQARSRSEEMKNELLRQSRPKMFSFKFVAHSIFLVILIVVFMKMIAAVPKEGLAEYNPYEVLDLETGAPMNKIKKQFRKLSLEYHPDKNVGNPKAKEIFLRISKAYETLTDPVARDNYEKYGNPDGRQAFEVGIGLPSFLLNEKGANSFFLMYFVGLVILIPTGVCIWNKRSKQYGMKGIMYKTYSLYHHFLKQPGTTPSTLVEVFACSGEFDKILFTPAQQNEIRELAKSLKNRIPKFKIQKEDIVMRSILLWAYLNRVDDMSPALTAALLQMLSKLQPLVEAMITVATPIRNQSIFLAVIAFSQHMFQAVAPGQSALLQLPHIDGDVLKRMNKKKNKEPALDLLMKTPFHKRKWLNAIEDEAHTNAINVMTSTIPRLSVSVEVGVEDEDLIAEGDIMNIKMTGTRYYGFNDETKAEEHIENNDDDDEHVGVEESKKNDNDDDDDDFHSDSDSDFSDNEDVSSSNSSVIDGDDLIHDIHAPFFPLPLEEKWYFLLSDPNERQCFGLINAEGKKGQMLQQVIRIQAPPKGTHELKLRVFSAQYIGVESTTIFKFNVLSREELPQVEMHPDDIALENEPTMFQQMMNEMRGKEEEEDSDSETDSEDEE
eukprot:TRINITY_DN328_c5_g1_i1.p1 TRINITY_DN328_c5_g1~~TRINITY_DN328_c5_g1_i1.p1  ORF type:complete len:652 (+),score=243.67 TRINITY_DN328_c5_g1_i1:59-2014(+)